MIEDRNVAKLSTETSPQTLAELAKNLAAITDILTVAQIDQLLQHVVVDEADIERYVHFSPTSYQRSIILKNANCEVLLLGWLPGQRSKIHNHKGSCCGLKVIRGCATETWFKHAENQMIFPVSSRELQQNRTALGEDTDIHQISNLTNASSLISLHIYSPSINQMSVFSLESKKVENSANVGGWVYEI